MEDDQLTNNLEPATSKLPIEVWSGVFEKLKSTPETVLNCREVCFDFKNEVDRKMIRWTKPPELDRLPLDESPVRKFPLTKINSRQSLIEFQNQMQNHGGNPFPTRRLSFHPKRGDRKDFCDCEYCRSKLMDVNSRFFQLSQHFGKHVHTLGITVINQNRIGQMMNYLFHNYPNLHQFEVKLRKLGTLCEPNAASLNLLREFNFPPLVHLTNLNLIFDEVAGETLTLITHMLKTYGNQVKALTVSGTMFESSGLTFENGLSDVLPNLTNLKIRYEPERRITNVLLNSLKSGKWSLKQLTMFQLDQRYLISDVMEVFSKLASTLEILHLYFPRETFLMLQLLGLELINKETPEEVADTLQLSVTLPLVQEFSLPFDCIEFAGGVITSRLCERFENLTTIHLWDDFLKNADYIMPNYEEKLNASWWPVLSPTSKLERVVIFSGNELDDNVVVHQVINKPAI